MQALGHTGDLGQSQPLKVDPKMSDAHDVSKAGQWAALTHPILSDNVRAARKRIMGDFACRPAFYHAYTDK